MINRDPNCDMPRQCKAAGTGLCRACAKRCGKYSAARKAALADPAVRARMSAAIKAALADPAVRARMEKKMGWLAAHERAAKASASPAASQARFNSRRTS